MLRYTEDHEWINLDGDTGAVGISPHAIEQLGDIVGIARALSFPAKRAE